MRTSQRLWPVPVLLSYGGFVLVGISGGALGVLLPAQIADYGIDMATIGVTFVTFSAGFFLAGASTGALVGRLGIRLALLVGGAAYLVAALVTAMRPSFVVLVGLQLVAGYGGGVLESVLSVYLSGLPSATVLLNRLHAFFGVGAFLGPLLATWMLGLWPWTAVFLVLGVLTGGLLIGILLAFPRARPDRPATDRPAEARSRREGTLGAVLRQPTILLATAFLTAYVGLEASLGSWGFTYLVEDQGQRALAAGYAISAYWLGLTVGRFAISPLAARWAITSQRMMLWCMAGVAGSIVLLALLPGPFAWIGFALVGFFLGPLFPTLMAVVPDLTSAALVPTAIGVLNGFSVVGAAALPWLAGALAEGWGIGTLLPFSLVLAVLQLVLWRAVVAREPVDHRR